MHPILDYEVYLYKKLPQNFRTFSFNLFATLVLNFNVLPDASPKLRAPLKKLVF